jgi:hypothetical protein
MSLTFDPCQRLKTRNDGQGSKLTLVGLRDRAQTGPLLSMWQEGEPMPTATYDFPHFEVTPYMPHILCNRINAVIVCIFCLHMSKQRWLLFLDKQIISEFYLTRCVLHATNESTHCFIRFA